MKWCRARLAVAPAVALALGILNVGSARAQSALPDEYFQIKNTSDQPGRSPIAVEGVVTLVLPPGAVSGDDSSKPTWSKAPDGTISGNWGPVEVLSGSRGFDPENFGVLLGREQPGEPAKQVLGLDFGPGGLKPGALFNFGLDLTTPPRDVKLELDLVVPEEAKGAIALQAITPVPEPATLLTWGVVAGGLALATRRRRSR